MSSAVRCRQLRKLDRSVADSVRRSASWRIRSAGDVTCSYRPSAQRTDDSWRKDCEFPLTHPLTPLLLEVRLRVYAFISKLSPTQSSPSSIHPIRPASFSERHEASVAIPSLRSRRSSEHDQNLVNRYRAAVTAADGGCRGRATAARRQDHVHVRRGMADRTAAVGQFRAGLRQEHPPHPREARRQRHADRLGRLRDHRPHRKRCDPRCLVHVQHRRRPRAGARRTAEGYRLVHVGYRRGRP